MQHSVGIWAALWGTLAQFAPRSWIYSVQRDGYSRWSGWMGRLPCWRRSSWYASPPISRWVKQLLPSEEVDPKSPTSSWTNSVWKILDHPPCLQSGLVQRQCGFQWPVVQSIRCTFYRVWKIHQPPTILCGDRGCSQIWPLVIHHVDLIIHCPAGGVRKVLRNVPSVFVEVVIELWLGIMRSKESDGLFKVFSVTQELPQVIDKISKLVVTGIFTIDSPSQGMFHEPGIFLVHRSFPGVNNLVIGSQAHGMGLQDGTVVATDFGVDFLSHFVECRAWILASGWGVSVQHCTYGEYSWRRSRWLCQLLPGGGCICWWLNRWWFLQLPSKTTIRVKWWYGHLGASGRLSVDCVLVAWWLEVCHIVRGCLWSVEWIHLPGSLFLQKESQRIDQWRYVWWCGYRNSTQDLSKGQTVRWIIDCFNNEELSCQSFNSLFISSLMMYLTIDNAYKVWRFLCSLTHAHTVWQCIHCLTMLVQCDHWLEPSRWDRFSGRRLLTACLS